MPSPFLRVPLDRILIEDALAFAFYDGFPVSEGHALVVTRRVVPTFFDCTPEEQAALMALVARVKSILDARYSPDGYNVGFNAGTAAGQTVPHVHIHVIPRYAGDMPDPRGGVRHVIPWKGNYLARPGLEAEADPQAALVTGGDDPLLGHLAPLLPRARKVAILAAFAQTRGVESLAPLLLAAARDGASVRVLTGDYRRITEPGALSALLALQAAHPGIGARLLCCADLPAPHILHAKAWRVEGEGFALAWVGSSNLSQAALTGSAEWNLRLDRRENPAAWTKLCRSFDGLWGLARPLTAERIARYAAAAPVRDPLPWPVDGGWDGEWDGARDGAPDSAEALWRGAGEEVRAGPVEPYGAEIPAPHPIQVGALAALAALRGAGRRRALIVLATGLGKTWLAAFDWLAVQAEIGRPPRLLFVAHRQELLMQAEAVFARLTGGRRSAGRFYGAGEGLGADMVFASVAKLSQARGLALLRGQAFDYVVVDEVHHATARSYRRVLDALSAGFLLGLTATPDRADAADVAALFDDEIAFRADIGQGVAIGRLVPFSYMGIRDTIDYRDVPWRSGEFDTAALERHALTEARMAALWEAWAAHPGTRTLLFCCTMRHASAVQRWLAVKGVAARCVHSGPESDDRTEALEALSAGRIAAICAVDLFNEGIDVPAVDRVILLRPTGSPVVFLQQIGRGLRAAAGKERLQVLDFVGNHRVFLGRLRTLAEAAGGSSGAMLGALLKGVPAELPSGCRVDLTLEAKEAIEALAAVPAASLLGRLYTGLRDRDGERPFAAEIVAMGLPLSAARARWGGWFGFVEGEGDLSEEEQAAWSAHRGWFEELERTPLTKCFKLILLESMLGVCGTAEAWAAGAEIGALAAHSHGLLQGRPELWAEVKEDVRFPALSAVGNRRRWTQYWQQNPVDAWCNSQFFQKVEGRLKPLKSIAVDAGQWEAFRLMTAELLDARRLQYRRRLQSGADLFTCKVIHSGGRPILILPASRPAALGSAGTDLTARLPSGDLWSFRFVKIACNVAGPPGSGQNRLTELLRGWFGPEAGQPGTVCVVRFARTADGWWAEPEQGG